MGFIRETQSGKDTYSLWMRRIEDQIEWLKKREYNGYTSWQACYLLDRAVHWASKKYGLNINNQSEKMEDKATIPLIATHVRNLIPFLYDKDPKFFGRPYDKDIESVAVQVDYLNFVYKEYKVGKQVKRTILDAAIIGHGVLRTGWNLEVSFPQTEDKGEIVYEDYIKKDAPSVTRINPFRFLFDRNAPESDLESARWCCELIAARTQDVIDDTRYDKKVCKKIESGEITPKIVRDYYKEITEDTQNQPLFEPLELGSSVEKTEYLEPDTLILLALVWDKKWKKKYTFVMSVDDPDKHSPAVLLEDPWPYDYLDGFPYLKVDFEEIPDDPYGIGHARYLIDIQKQINRNRSKIYSITRMFNPQYTHTGDEPLDAKSKLALKQDILGEVIELNRGDTLELKALPRLTNDLYNVATMLSQDYSEVSGRDILTRGGNLTSRTSAEEIRERRFLRGQRLETNVNNTRELVLNVGKHIILHARHNLQLEVNIPVLGSSFGEKWRKVKRDNLQTVFGLDLGVVSKPLDDPDTKFEKILRFLSIVSNPNILQILQSQQVPINFGALMKGLIEELDIDEVALGFPQLMGVQDNSIPPDLSLFNTGNPPQEGSNNSTERIQRNNVQPSSRGQGIEGILQQLQQT